MAEIKNINERMMLDRFRAGETILAPLILHRVMEESREGADACVEIGFPEDTETFAFALESKARSTSDVFHGAIQQALLYTRLSNLHPMIQVPYLSPTRLEELENLKVSGIDMCGNGFVFIPNRLCVLRSGKPNLYPDSRSLVNPFQGRSAMVARMLIMQPEWETLSELAEAIGKHSQARRLSLSQVSKAISTLSEDLIVIKDGQRIRLVDPTGLLDGLNRAWRQRLPRRQRNYRSVDSNLSFAKLSADKKLKWSLTGESSASRYGTMAQAGPQKLAVSDLELAESLLPIEPESVPNFADIVFMQTDDDAYFFANEEDDAGIRYASRVQTWLELNTGDGRQRDTARDLYQAIIEEAKR